MSKTPEEMALEYIKNVETARNPSVTATAFPQMQRCFLAGYKAAQQWISVKDRLPEDRDIVAVWTNCGDIHAAWREDGCWLMFNPCCTYESELKGVSHWHEIEDVPEEEK